MSIKVDKELMRAHLDLFRAIKHEMKPSSSITNLTLVQLNALIFLGDNTGAHVSDVANYFGIATPTATVLLDRLTSLRLVQRLTDKKDRRVIRVVLTKKGEKLLASAMRERETVLKKVFAKLSTKDKNDFLRIMKNITQN